jgi:hypothetical protein
MGNFLDTPIVDKETEVGGDAEKNLSFGVSAMQGWRAQMEDDHLHLCRMHENVRTNPPCGPPPFDGLPRTSVRTHTPLLGCLRRPSASNCLCCQPAPDA